MNSGFEMRRAPRLLRSSEAADSGVSDWRLRTSARLRTMTVGIRADLADTRTRPVPHWADALWEETSLQLQAAQLLHPSLAAGHLTAARLYGLPLPRGLADRRLHVATGDMDLRIRRPGLVVHRLSDFAVVSWLGHRLLDGPRLFLQLAPLLSRDDLVCLGDAMVGRWHGPPLCTLEDLVGHAGAKSYVRSRKKVDAALGLVRSGVDSPQESKVRLWAISVGLPEPEVHPPVYCRSLGCTIHPDLGYRRARLALEYEGEHHLTDRGQWDTDIARVNALVEEGWVVLRVNARTDFRALERMIRARLGLREES